MIRFIFKLVFKNKHRKNNQFFYTRLKFVLLHCTVQFVRMYNLQSCMRLILFKIGLGKTIHDCDKIL